jgi:hypothetical protein
MAPSDTTELIVGSVCLIVVVACEITLLYKVTAKAPSRFLKLFTVLLLTGTLFGVIWTILRYWEAKGFYAVEASLLFLANTPLSLTYLLYACRL